MARFSRTFSDRLGGGAAQQRFGRNGVALGHGRHGHIGQDRGVIRGEGQGLSPCGAGVVGPAHLLICGPQQRPGLPVVRAGVAGLFEGGHAIKGLTARDMGAADLQHGVDVSGLDDQHGLCCFGGLIVAAEVAQRRRRLHAGDRIARIDVRLIGPEHRPAQGVRTLIGGAHLGAGGLARRGGGGLWSGGRGLLCRRRGLRLGRAGGA
jgi:hypothetical protein